MDLREAEDIKKRWQEYTEELTIQKRKSRRARYPGITMNKASGDDGIPAEVVQILQDDAVKVLHSISQQIRKTQQCHRTGKGQC